MAANTAPIFSATPSVKWTAGITAAANDYTGAGANNVTAFTAGSNGSFVQRLRFKALGTNVATVARVFISSGTGGNSFMDEISLPAITASANTATASIDLPMNFAIPAGYTIIVGLGTAVASGWLVSVIAGDY